MYFVGSVIVLTYLSLLIHFLLIIKKYKFYFCTNSTLIK